VVCSANHESRSLSSQRTKSKYPKATIYARRKVTTLWDGVGISRKHLLRATEASALAGLLPHEFPPRHSRLMRGGLLKVVNFATIWWGRNYEPGRLFFSVRFSFAETKENWTVQSINFPYILA